MHFQELIGKATVVKPQMGASQGFGSLWILFVVRRMFCRVLHLFCRGSVRKRLGVEDTGK